MENSLPVIACDLARQVDILTFGPPVSHVYNPLIYAWRSHLRYLEQYGRGRKEVVLVGMNPGPWGMAQTGVPFGDVEMVRDWLGIEERVEAPAHSHPKRPVNGFECRRSEVSGRRVWGWARDRFGTPENFFARFFIANYCPLCFLEESGRNRTPDRLPKSERESLLAFCDRALYRAVLLLRPRHVVGVGRFAAERVAAALEDLPVAVGGITHPSPANPRANKGWAQLAEKELGDQGIAA
jgi:single-strand selective monofunctional uracil DNA glycosylase